MAPQRITRHGMVLPETTKPIYLDLTPLHAIIGPAGVGKTTVLDILRTIYNGSAPPLSALFTPEAIQIIQSSWGLVQKYYPEMESIFLKGEHAFLRTKKGSEFVLTLQLNPSLIEFFSLITLPYHFKRIPLLALDTNHLNFHPEQIADAMKLLRKAADSGVQVVLATNNPLVINEMKPEEVTLLTRGEHGPVATLLKDTWNFAERSRFYSLGELWLLHGGNNEHDLLHEPEPARLPTDEERAWLQAAAELPEIPGGASGGMVAAHRRKMRQADQIVTERDENEGE